MDTYIVIVYSLHREDKEEMVEIGTRTIRHKFRAN
jgi:hypothetical protein